MNAVERNQDYREFLAEYPKTGRGTPAGEMLRRYWHPLCLSRDLKDLPFPIRMLGEDLVAFRAIDGKVGLLGARCPHRCASLAYGQLRAEGLQCSYHGWTFNAQGKCVLTPLEPADSTLLNEVTQPWYPAEEWGGMIWCYMGPDKEAPPPLPKIDILSRTDGEVVLQAGEIRNYNYLSFLENFVDMGHSFVLHLIRPGTLPDELRPHCDLTVDNNWRNIRHEVLETPFGMKSVTVQNTFDPDTKYVNTWSLALPTFYRFSGILAGLPPDFTNDRRESGGMLRIIDDEHFELFRYALVRSGNFRGTFYPRANDTIRGISEGITGVTEKKDYDYRKYPAWEGRPVVEDLVIQESQGAIPHREEEYLGKSDVGVALLRRIWRQSMNDVAAGKSAKMVMCSADGVVEVDTFKGVINAGDIRIGPENMPSSKDGRGLIRDAQGHLVFG